ncbi:hypothetical protein [Sphingomonas sp. R86521]|uniref:hypothetical protein n=1 Tax=Sphingomonas sp. R86521 TaxID=3093860 RepID=UPI0036D43B8D
MIAAVSSPALSKCALPFEIVGNEAAAKAIAQVVLASAPPPAPSKDIRGYDLHVEYLRERNSWIVYQSPIPTVEGVRFLGGGGLGMEIAACDGAVSDINRQR